jgi:hypothetical protein
MAAGGAAGVLVLATSAYALFGTGGRPPGLVLAAPPVHAAPTVPGGIRPSTMSTGVHRASSPGRSSAAAQSVAPAATVYAPPPAADSPTATAQAGTMALRPPQPPDPAVPSTARTGTIGGLGGLCLDVDGGVPKDGTVVQVFTCNGSAAQTWTIATDGTLAVVGKCAEAAADESVHITACAGGNAQQWRSAPNSALVNQSNGECLTDPAAGQKPLGAVALSPCAGADNQRWNLP